MGHLIKHILSRTGPVHGVLDGPGGRHDNDLADFRDITILLTADEILCRKPPFLRTPSHHVLSASETLIKVYFDNTVLACVVSPYVRPLLLLHSPPSCDSVH